MMKHDLKTFLIPVDELNKFQAPKGWRFSGYTEYTQPPGMALVSCSRILRVVTNVAGSV